MLARLLCVSYRAAEAKLGSVASQNGIGHTLVLLMRLPLHQRPPRQRTPNKEAPLEATTNATFCGSSNSCQDPCFQIALSLHRRQVQRLNNRDGTQQCGDTMGGVQCVNSATPLIGQNKVIKLPCVEN